MSRLRVAVIGVGQLGRIHARLIQQLDEVELIAVVDPSASSRTEVASECGCLAIADHRSLLGSLDAAIVATPTRYHHDVGIDLLKSGAHLFVEKPIALSVDEAESLISMADAHSRVLQVGHIERFNPALSAALPYARQAKYIEATRCSGYTFRSTDIGVVLDLMIHDIDIVLSLMQCRVVDVQALGLAVFGPQEDMAQARLTFANGCVANLSASRTSYEACRRMQTYGPLGFASIDFAERTTRIVHPSPRVARREIAIDNVSQEEQDHIKTHLFDELLPLETPPVAETNPLLDELADFVGAIREGRPPMVTGQDGGAALSVAHRILHQINAHRWNGMDADGPTGPLPQIDAPLQGPHWHQAPQPARHRKAG